MWKIIYVLWQASKDNEYKGVHEWIIMASCLELFLLLWSDVHFVYGNVKRYHISVALGNALQERAFTISRWSSILWRQTGTSAKFFTLTCSRHFWSLSHKCKAKNMYGTILYQRHRKAFHTLCWHSTVLQVFELFRQM